MSKGHQHPLTSDQIVQVNTICNRFELAWQNGHVPSIEAAAAGSDSLIRPALLQHLAELDLQCRVIRGADIDLDVYLTRWPDLDRAALQKALDAAQKTGATSLFSGATAATAAAEKTSRAICSVNEFFSRLKESRLLPDSEIDMLATAARSELSSTSLGKKLVEAHKLTSFQVNSLLEGNDDPLTLGDYVLQDFVGRGGMGTVYRAVHRRMKRTVAIKVLRRDIPYADILSRRFLREVEVAAKLCHPNIVTAYDAGEQNGISYLVSEFVEGQNLGDLVKQYGPLSLPLAVDVLQQAARALSYAHNEGVIHRDIKPSNLLLDDAGNVKLLDVGLARINQTELSEPDAVSDLTTTGMIMGTVDYMSPEQAQNTRLADERSDVYSLGCTLYFLITGRAPFARGTAMERLLAHREQPIPSFRSLSPLIPEQLDDILKSLLAKKPAERMTSMDELVQQLESLKAAELPDVTLPLSAAEDELMTSVASEAEPGPTQHKVAPDVDSSGPDFSETAVSEPAATSARKSAACGLPQILTGDQQAAASRKRPSTSQVSILPWVIIPGLVAILFLIWYLRPATDPVPLPHALTKRAVAELLTEKSEAEVRQYRSSWATESESPEEQTIQGVIFKLIPPGRFMFGEGGTAVEVAIENAFYLSEVEVTVGQYRTFVKASNNYQTMAERDGTGWGLNSGRWVQGPEYSWKNPGENPGGDSIPATSIAYPDALAFCQWMSAQTGRKIRLPTEEEWEYACRCGRRGRWSFGDDQSLINEYAWTQSDSQMQIHPVRSLLPNAWGLYDMHGNEYEWCFAENAQPPEFAGTGPVRGGGFSSSPDETACSARLQTELNQPARGAFRVLMEQQR